VEGRGSRHGSTGHRCQNRLIPLGEHQSPWKCSASPVDHFSMYDHCQDAL
jgi:hypothetical protein